MTTATLAQFPMLPVNGTLGSIDQYVQAVGRIPMLSPDEELKLGRAWQQEQNVESAHRLVLSHLRLVVSVSRQYLGYGLPQADLIQEGNVGLMKAVRRFDPERGVRLVSFALHWIKAEMHEYMLRNWRLVKVATTKSQRKLFFNLRSAKGNISTLSKSDAARIASDLGVKPEEVFEMDTRMGGRDITFDPTPTSDSDEPVYSPLPYLTNAEDEPSPILETAQNESNDSQGLHSALDKLDARSRAIVARRWLVEDGEGATLQELAAEYGVSAERIRQIEAKALQTMKLQLA